MSERVVLVTGANRGIGREVARQLAEADDTVIPSAHDEGRARAAAEELSGETGRRTR